MRSLANIKPSLKLLNLQYLFNLKDNRFGLQFGKSNVCHHNTIVDHPINIVSKVIEDSISIEKFRGSNAFTWSWALTLLGQTIFALIIALPNAYFVINNLDKGCNILFFFGVNIEDYVWPLLTNIYIFEASL